jgi:hypothetical protein
MKVTIVDGKTKPAESTVSGGDIIMAKYHGYFLVAQVEGGVYKLINIQSGNRQRDLGTFQRNSSFKAVLDANNLPNDSILVKAGEYRLELEY